MRTTKQTQSTRKFLPSTIFQRGQALLITLLVLSVATTIVLSLIGRTTQDVSISREIEESSQAFNAAEAGVEEALISGTGTSSPQEVIAGSGVKYNVTIADTGGAVGTYTLPKRTLKGATDTLWLVAHNGNALVEVPTYKAASGPTTLELCWSSETTAPALVVSVLYKEQSDQSYQVAKLPLDPLSRSNNFAAVGGASSYCNNQTNVYHKIIDFSADLGIDATTDTLIALRIRPVYSDTQLYVNSGSIVLPLQGKRIESAGSTLSGVNRKILVFQQFRSPSTIFDASIYSQNSFSH